MLGWCLPAFIPWKLLVSFQDMWETKSLSLGMKFQVKEIGPFHRKTEVMFQSDLCAMPWGGGGGWPAKHCLADCYSSVKHRNTSPLATRAKQSRGVPVWINCACWIYLDSWRV